jgi:hypothetical protein
MDKVLEALRALVEAYTKQVGTKHDGYWNAEAEPVVINARAAIAAYEAETGWVRVPRKTLDSLYNEMANNSRPDYIKCAGYVGDLKLAAALQKDTDNG